MKLNFEAVRDLLLILENQSSDIDINYVVSNESLKKYSHSELGYALEKMLEAKLLDGQAIKTKDGILFNIKSITTNGHSFLETIRPQTVWDKTKSTLKTLGKTSLPTLINIAGTIFKEYVKSII